MNQRDNSISMIKIPKKILTLIILFGILFTLKDQIYLNFILTRDLEYVKKITSEIYLEKKLENKIITSKNDIDKVTREILNLKFSGAGKRANSKEVIDLILITEQEKQIHFKVINNGLNEFLIRNQNTFFSIEAQVPQKNLYKLIEVLVGEKNNFLMTNEFSTFSGETVNKQKNTTFTPNQDEVEKASIVFQEKLENEASKLKSITDYKIQFSGHKNENNERIIKANFICLDYIKNNNIDWRNEYILVDDGGNCFFHISVNIDTENIETFSINGES